MATRLAIREKQLATWTAIIQECRNTGMKTKDRLAENSISKDQYYYWFKQLRLAACMQASGSQPELPVETEKQQIVKLECADYQNDLDSCSSSKIRIDRGRYTHRDCWRCCSRSDPRHHGGPCRC